MVGHSPLLDSISYTVLDDAARIPALLNNSIDVAGVISLDELKTTRPAPGIAIQRAPSPQWYHMTFNGAPGSILADPALRMAVAKGIDRQAIVTVAQNGLVEKPVPLNNHIYLAGQEGYQDNSIPFDPEAAKRELDALGWRQNGQFREKDGRRLTIRDVFYDARSTGQIGQIAQNNLAQIGVDLQLVRAAGGKLFTDFVTPGNFDIVQFAYAGDAFALSVSPRSMHQGQTATTARSAAPRSTPRSSRRSQVDPAKARTLANELDTMIWQEVHSLPLFQAPGNVAVRARLANYGPAGIGDLNYSAIGFMK